MRLGRLTMAFATVTALAGPALAQEPIKVGEINSYKVIPAFLEPYRKGWELAVEEINKSGGINGRPLEVVSRDDNGAPGDAVRAAEELVSREGVVLLTGGFLSHVGLAVADFAKQRKMPFIASEPLTDKIVWENGNAYTFRLRASTYMQTSMLVEEAVKLNKKRWALVYPNYEYGQSAINSFKQLMTARQPGVEFVVEQAPPLNRIDAGSVARRDMSPRSRPRASTASALVSTIPTSGRRRSTSSCSASLSGCHASSESRSAIASPLACAMPWFRAADTPPFGLRRTRTRSPNRAHNTSAVPSVEPSSTMMIS